MGAKDVLIAAQVLTMGCFTERSERTIVALEQDVSERLASAPARTRAGCRCDVTAGVATA